MVQLECFCLLWRKAGSATATKLVQMRWKRTNIEHVSGNRNAAQVTAFLQCILLEMLIASSQEG
ncbi:MAG: hypothetical protein EA407_11160 [Rhodobacteraceae bacterium]|nr:MAG: hypothetical protein EA407_11160 [Paracoccaceae bacterium]